MSGKLPVATNHYVDVAFERQGVKLLPNEFFVTTDDMVLTTVLGSCVAACIRDPVAGIGGMNHFMLPDDEVDTGDATPRAASDAMRYGAYAMEVLLNELLKGGARRERLEAKVFGGAAVLAGMTTLNIGDRNSDFVVRYLSLEKVRVAAEDLRGPHPRKVCYLPATGQAMVRKLPVQQQTGVARVERELVRDLAEHRAERLAGRVELFGTPAPAPASQKASAPRPRIELFGAAAAKQAKIVSAVRATQGYTIGEEA